MGKQRITCSVSPAPAIFPAHLQQHMQQRQISPITMKMAPTERRIAPIIDNLKHKKKCVSSIGSILTSQPSSNEQGFHPPARTKFGQKSFYISPLTEHPTNPPFPYPPPSHLHSPLYICGFFRPVVAYVCHYKS